VSGHDRLLVSQEEDSMLTTSPAPVATIRRAIVALLLASLGILGINAAPAMAGEFRAGTPSVLRFVLESGPQGPALPGGRLAVEAPVTAIADRQLLADLDKGARLDGLRVGEPTPQAGPYHDSTTWSWEICVWVTFPDGTHYEYCIGLTITISTDIDAPPPDHTGAVRLTGNERRTPLKVCWTETLDDGTVVKHCIDITITAGGGRQD
jgi:hypothetical protein